MSLLPPTAARAEIGVVDAVEGGSLRLCLADALQSAAAWPSPDVPASLMQRRNGGPTPSTITRRPAH